VFKFNLFGLRSEQSLIQVQKLGSTGNVRNLAFIQMTDVHQTEQERLYIAIKTNFVKFTRFVSVTMNMEFYKMRPENIEFTGANVHIIFQKVTMDTDNNGAMGGTLVCGRNHRGNTTRPTASGRRMPQ
jgi:hypothetical protein